MRLQTGNHNRIAQNAGWLIGGKAVQMLISLMVGMLTARFLGPGNYGLIQYAAAYTAFFASVCTLGIHSVLVRELIDAPQNDGMIMGTALGLQTASSLCSVIAICAFSAVFDRGEPTTVLVVALYSLGSVFHVFDTFHLWFGARLQSKISAAASLIAYTAAAIYKIVLLLLGKSVVYFACTSSIEALCVAAILYFCYRREQGGRLSFSLTYGRDLLGRSYHYILSGMMIAVYGQTDRLMLKHMMHEAETGYYAAAATLSSLWCFVLSAIIDSVNPSVMRAYHEDKTAFDRWNRRLYCIVFYLCAAVSAGFMIFGEVLIGLFYGDAYLPAVQPLKIMTWYTAFSYLGVARNAWVVCNHTQKYLKYICASAAAVNVMLNLLLIPSMGAVGAAIASLVTQFVTVFVTPFLIRDMRANAVLMIQAICFRGIGNGESR